MSKYRNHKVEIDGVKFDSKREAAHWQDLKLLLRAGKINGLDRQVVFKLADPVKFPEAKKKQPALRMIVDFAYYENGIWILEDVKSDASITTAFTIKRHLLKAIHGLDIRISK